jgi:hypothetical protein
VSVITCIHDDYYQCDDRHRKCTICGELLYYPFICWDEEDALYICGPCCRKYKRGLMADLVQLSAIVELRSIDIAYQGHVLERTSLTDIKDRALLQLAKEHSTMRARARTVR